MMTPHASQNIARAMPAVALAITAMVWTVWGPERAVAAAVGGGLASLNWVALRWLLGRATAGSAQHRAGFLLLSMLKMGALMGLIYVLLNRFQLEPLGLLMGLGTLFFGPVLGVLLGTGTDASTAEAVGKER